MMSSTFIAVVDSVISVSVTLDFLVEEDDSVVVANWI